MTQCSADSQMSVLNQKAVGRCCPVQYYMYVNRNLWSVVEYLVFPHKPGCASFRRRLRSLLSVSCHGGAGGLDWMRHRLKER